MEISNEIFKKNLILASQSNRNFIIDQTNVVLYSRIEKLQLFEDFYKEAVVLVLSEQEQKKRMIKKERFLAKNSFLYPKMCLESFRNLQENFILPDGEGFNSVVYPELDEEKSHRIVFLYNEIARQQVHPLLREKNYSLIKSKRENVLNEKNKILFEDNILKFNILEKIDEKVFNDLIELEKESMGELFNPATKTILTGEKALAPQTQLLYQKGFKRNENYHQNIKNQQYSQNPANQPFQKKIPDPKSPTILSQLKSVPMIHPQAPQNFKVPKPPQMKPMNLNPSTMPNQRRYPENMPQAQNFKPAFQQYQQQPQQPQQQPLQMPSNYYPFQFFNPSQGTDAINKNSPKCINNTSNNLLSTLTSLNSNILGYNIPNNPNNMANTQERQPQASIVTNYSGGLIPNPSAFNQPNPNNIMFAGGHTNNYTNPFLQFTSQQNAEQSNLMTTLNPLNATEAQKRANQLGNPNVKF